MSDQTIATPKRLLLVLSGVEERFAKTGKCASAMLAFSGLRIIETPAGIFMHDHDTKELLESVMVSLATHPMTDVVCLIQEAWMVVTPSPEDVNDAMLGKLYKNSKRIEIVNVIYEELATGGNFGAIAHIIRPPELNSKRIQQKPRLGPWKILFDDYKEIDAEMKAGRGAKFNGTFIKAGRWTST